VRRPDGPAAGTHAHIDRVTGGEQLVCLPRRDVLTMADGFDHAGARALAHAGRVAQVACSPHLLGSAPFSPATAAAAEAAVVALAGALVAWSAEIGTHAQDVRTAVALIEGADSVVHEQLLRDEQTLALAYGRESVAPRVRRTSLEVTMSSTAPTGLASLVDHVGQVSLLADDPVRRGAFEIQTITGAEGGRRHVVYLPGVDEWNVPGRGTGVRDLGAAVSLSAGGRTAYGAGVLEALHEAGVAPGERVLLVGHSEGGMQAIQLAARASPYDITRVVTLGSPTVPDDLPPDVQVLALEHEGDPVPLLDAGAAPSRQVVSMRFDTGSAVPSFDKHHLTYYSAGAAAAEQSTDPALREAIAGISPFLARPGDRVDSTVFQIARGDRPQSWELLR